MSNKKQCTGTDEELKEIGRNTLERAHAIRNSQTIFGLALTEMRELLSHAAKGDRVLTASETGVLNAYLTTAEQSFKRIDLELQGILQFGRVLQLKLEPTEINKRLSLMSGAMKGSGKFAIEFRTQLCEKLQERRVQMDWHHVVNCVFDLVKNAAEAGAKEVVITTSIETRPDGQFVDISIANDGEEIPHDVISRIFDFSFTTKNKGNGVGLAQVRRIVEAHDGHIDVQSNQKLTTFRLLFPL